MFIAKLLSIVLLPAWLIAAPFDGLDLYPQPYQIDVIPYIQSNEFCSMDVFQELTKTPCEPFGVHIGWSIEFNFKIIALRRPYLAIICDINKRVFEFFNIFKSTILASNSDAEFLDQLKAILEPQENYFFNTKSRTLSKAFKSYAEWMSEENFQLIKQMYAENRIIHFVLNVKDSEDRFFKLAKWIRDHGYFIDTVYASNISQWVGMKDLFCSNLRQLIENNTLFIDTFHGRKKKLPLPLRTTHGSLPNF